MPKKRKPSIVHRSRVHRLLQSQAELASPVATRFLVAALDRIALHLARRSAQLATDDDRKTIKPRDMERAWNEFMVPRQAITWTANELRHLTERLETRGQTSGGNLPPDLAAPTDDMDGQDE